LEHGSARAAVTTTTTTRPADDTGRRAARRRIQSALDDVFVFGQLKNYNILKPKAILSVAPAAANYN